VQQPQFTLRFVTMVEIMVGAGALNAGNRALGRCSSCSPIALLCNATAAAKLALLMVGAINCIGPCLLQAPIFEAGFFQSFARPSLWDAYTGWGLDFVW